MKAFDKLSTRSAVFISLTSMLGAGIFIKVRTINALAHNHVTPIIFLFLLFFLSMLAFSYAFMKIIPSQTGDMGFMDWSKRFCNKRLHQDFSRFVKNLYYPVSLFLFSTYGVLGITGEKFGICATLGLSLFFVLLFLIVSFVSFKWSRRFQLILSMLVVIPLFILPFMGIISPGGTGEDVGAGREPTFWEQDINGSESATGISSWGPWMILISGLPSLLFIYDGFYSIASLKSKLRDPGKLTSVILIAMSLVTLIYIYVITGFNVGDPNHTYFGNFKLLVGKTLVIDMFDLLISCASFLTLNSIIMGCVPQLKAMHYDRRFEDVERIRKYIFYKKNHEDESFEERFSILLSVIWKTVVVTLLAGIVIGVMTSFNLSHTPKDILHALADIVTIFVFVILLATIYGSYRKNHLRDSQLFRLCSKVCGGLIITSLAYLIISYVVGTTGYAESDMFNSCLKLIILVSFAFICFYPRIYDWLRGLTMRRRFMSYERYKRGNIITIE